MKLLFVTGTLPYPPTDGWKIRVFALLRGLAQRHSVSVVSFVRRIDDALAEERLRDQGIDLHVIRRDHRYAPSKLFQGLVGQTAFPILNYRDDRMTRLLHGVLQSETFDIVQVESIHMAQYCLGLPQTTILDLHNIESLLMRRYARQESNPLKRLYAEVTWRKLAAYERETCGRFSHCLTCSDEERVLLQTRSGVDRVTVIPNGVDMDAYAADDNELPNGAGLPPGDRVVFVGRMDYHANVEGVRWFSRHVWPRIRANRPGAIFQIVGGYPVPAISRLARAGEIEVTGFVRDVRPYVRQASVVVVPLRVGGGTRLKILEALALGKPLVSTTVGAEGIEAVPDRDLVIADRPEAFGDEVVSLLSQSQRREALGDAGRRLVQSQYNWKSIVKELETIYEHCLDIEHPARRTVQCVG
jgi:sugar transferase (PEP-CTERM/EpsH1 system associated)